MSYVTHIDKLVRALPEVLQQRINDNAHRLAAMQRGNVSPDAPAAPAIAAGYYVRTTAESGYQRAVSTVESMFASGWEALFSQSWAGMFASSWGDLFAQDWEAVLSDPQILPEIGVPEPGSAFVANCTGWATQNEFGGGGKPSFFATLSDFEFDWGGFSDDWKKAAGV